jgi:hypothetical protein
MATTVLSLLALPKTGRSHVSIAGASKAALATNLKDKKGCGLALIGPKRVGKSLMATTIARTASRDAAFRGFRSGDTTTPVTVGVDAAVLSLACRPGEVLLLLDAEGMGDASSPDAEGRAVEQVTILLASGVALLCVVQSHVDDTVMHRLALAVRAFRDATAASPDTPRPKITFAVVSDLRLDPAACLAAMRRTPDGAAVLSAVDATVVQLPELAPEVAAAMQAPRGAVPLAYQAVVDTVLAGLTSHANAEDFLSSIAAAHAHAVDAGSADATNLLRVALAHRQAAVALRRARAQADSVVASGLAALRPRATKLRADAMAAKTQADVDAVDAQVAPLNADVQGVLLRAASAMAGAGGAADRAAVDASARATLKTVTDAIAEAQAALKRARDTLRAQLQREADERDRRRREEEDRIKDLEKAPPIAPAFVPPPQPSPPQPRPAAVIVGVAAGAALGGPVGAVVGGAIGRLFR